VDRGSLADWHRAPRRKSRRARPLASDRSQSIVSVGKVPERLVGRRNKNCRYGLRARRLCGASGPQRSTTRMVYVQATPAERRDDSDMSVLHPLQFAGAVFLTSRVLDLLFQFAVAGQLLISGIQALKAAAWNGLPDWQRTGCFSVSFYPVTLLTSAAKEMHLKCGYWITLRSAI